MSAACLVLSRAFSPVNVYASYKDAVTKVEAGRAEVIATYPNTILRSWKQAKEAPAIIRLLYFAGNVQKRGRFMRLSRKNLWLRDKAKCCYCNKAVTLAEMHWDHVVPRDQGGISSWENLVVSCQKCNSRKANRTPIQAGMPLLKTPIAPKYVLSLEKEMLLKLKSLKYFPHTAWQDYLYWDIELER
jgi:5-methylcytosine-specific restriction endonuclease McrA